MQCRVYTCEWCEFDCESADLNRIPGHPPQTYYSNTWLSSPCPKPSITSLNFNDLYLSRQGSTLQTARCRTNALTNRPRRWSNKFELKQAYNSHLSHSFCPCGMFMLLCDSIMQYCLIWLVLDLMNYHTCYNWYIWLNVSSIGNRPLKLICQLEATIL